MYEISCEMCMDLIPLVIDGAASQDSQKAVEHHIESCAGCRAFFDGETIPKGNEDQVMIGVMRKLRLFTAAILLAGCAIGFVSVAMVLGELSAIYFVLVLAVVGLLRFALGDDAGGKGKWKRRIATFAGIALAVFLLVLANAFAGNPVSWLLAKNAAKEYLAQTYPGTDYYAERVTYNFKTGGYYAVIDSPSSADTYFDVSIDMLGNVKYDGYADYVASGWNTADRISSAYRELVDTVLEDPSLPYFVDIGFGDIEFMPAEFKGNPGVPEYALIMEDLVLDKEYDLMELASKAGHLVIYVDDDTVTMERAAELLLDIRARMDLVKIKFHAVHFVLTHPRPEDGSPTPDGRVEVIDFLYEDIYEEDLAERVEKANEAAIAYYAEMDAK